MASGQDPHLSSAFYQCGMHHTSNNQPLVCQLRVLVSLFASIALGTVQLNRKGNGDDLHIIVNDIVQQVSPSSLFVYRIVSPQVSRNGIYVILLYFKCFFFLFLHHKHMHRECDAISYVLERGHWFLGRIFWGGGLFISWKRNSDLGRSFISSKALFPISPLFART